MVLWQIVPTAWTAKIMDECVSSLAIGSVRWPGTGKVLIIDDMDFIRDIFCRQLTRIGCDCHQAATHQQAWDLMQTVPIAVAVVDFPQPHQQSVELVKRIQQHFPQTIIIGHSAYNRREDFADIGVEQFLMKPWRVTDLIEIVRSDDRY